MTSGKAGVSTPVVCYRAKRVVGFKEIERSAGVSDFHFRSAHKGKSDDGADLLAAAAVFPECNCAKHLWIGRGLTVCRKFSDFSLLTRPVFGRLCRAKAGQT